jgi:peroxiredoxin (alkyl hydroperoxide reductase subunit C)
MSLIQNEAPGFEAEAIYPDGTIQPVNLYDYRGKYLVLFFYPMDFTFVCPTEIVAFSERIAEFHQRGVEVLGVSVDSVYSHFAWRNIPRREGGIGEITFPLVSDLDKAISRSYGVLLEKPPVALRGTFLIDQKGIVRSAMVNDLPLGRNIDETLRLLDALHQVEQYGEVCPANWHAGDDAMKATPESLKVYAQAHLA